MIHLGIYFSRNIHIFGTLQLAICLKIYFSLKLMTLLYSSSSVPYIPFAMQKVNFIMNLPKSRCFKQCT